MANDSDIDPTDEGHGVRPPNDQDPLVRPRAMTIASGLWTCLGVMFVLGAIAWYGSPESAELNTGPIVPLLVIGFGVAFIVYASRLRRGHEEARVALTALGAISLIGIWTALLVIPALVLQHRPASREWLDSVYRARQTEAASGQAPTGKRANA